MGTLAPNGLVEEQGWHRGRKVSPAHLLCILLRWHGHPLYNDIFSCPDIYNTVIGPSRDQSRAALSSTRHAVRPLAVFYSRGSAILVTGL